MARIRTIKPEFWTDSKIVGLPIEARLLFIGIWNFADDHGCIDADPLQLRLRILPADPIDPQPLIDQLLERRLLREMVNDATGETFFQVTNWGRHQRINRPSSPQFGDPNDWREVSQSHDTSPDDAPPPHVALREPSVSPLSHKGKEGKGKEGKGRDAATRVDSATDATAQTLLAEHIDAHPQRPPGRVVGQTAREIKALVDEGWPPDAIRAGLAIVRDRGLHPSTIASCVNEAANPPPRSLANGQQPRLTAAEQKRVRTLQAIQTATGGTP